MALRWNGFILHVALLAITLCQSVSALMWLHKRQPIVPNISELFPLLNGIWKFIAVLVRICHWFYPFFFFYHGATVPRGSQGLLIIEAFRSHSDTHTHSVGLLWTQRPLPDNTQHSQQTDIHAAVGFEPAISPNERPQTDVLDGAATEICTHSLSKRHTQQCFC